MKKSIIFILFILNLMVLGHFSFADEHIIFDFNKAKVSSDRITEKGKTIGRFNNKYKNSVSITENGKLFIGDTRYEQRVNINYRKFNYDNLGIMMKLNVKSMGNNGHIKRPIFKLVLGQGSNGEEYYIVYHLEEIYRKNISANFFRSRWSFVSDKGGNIEILSHGIHELSEFKEYVLFITWGNNNGKGNVKLNILGERNNENECCVLNHDFDGQLPFENYGSISISNAGFNGDIWGSNSKIVIDDIVVTTKHHLDSIVDDFYKFATTAINSSKEEFEKNIYSQYLTRGIKGEDKITDDQIFEIFQEYYGYSIKKYPKDLGELNILNFSLLLKYYSDPDNLFVGEGYWKIVSETLENKEKRAVEFVLRKGYIDFSEKKLTDNLLYEDVLRFFIRIQDTSKRTSMDRLTVSDLFSSGAVIQKGRVTKVYGEGISGDKVTVRFAGISKTVPVVNGKWFTEMLPLNYGGPYSLTIEDSQMKIKNSNIYVGEVFVVAGQSNAEMPLSECEHGDTMIKKYSGDDQVRVYRDEHIIANEVIDVSDGIWYNSFDWALKDSTALGVFFADKLIESNESLENIKIGIVQLTYGGSTIELFLPEEVFEDIGYEFVDYKPINSGFWNGYIHKVSGYGAKALIYYQGENSIQLKYEYEYYLRKYIEIMRRKLGNSRLQVYLVQISGYGENYYETDIDLWPIIREVQMRVSNTVNNVGIVTSIDLSDEDPMEIHPKDKRNISDRIVELANKDLFDKSEAKTSPIVDEYIRGNGYGIVKVNQKIQINRKNKDKSGFEILDENNKWKEARISLSDDLRSIIVWNEQVKEVNGIRYSWRNYPYPSIFNNDGLPLLPYNSQKDTNIAYKNITTNRHNVRLLNHFMYDYDGIVNKTRDKQFRMVLAKNSNILWHEYKIEGQQAGDEIIKLRSMGKKVGYKGTDETTIMIPNHGVRKGDWIRNNTRLWEVREVTEIIDDNTFLVEAIYQQTLGDEIEIYSFLGLSKALK